jgi:uncharacterized OsmC-like protein
VSQAAAQLKIKLDDERVEVEAKFQEQGSVLAGSKSGSCLGFEIQISIDSPESTDKIKTLLETAHRMCFTEDALDKSTPVSTTHIINGKEQ